MIREYDTWAWAAGILMLWLDLMLPVPQTSVIAALGIVYGTFVGGMISSVGLISGGLIGYGLMRSPAVQLLLSATGPRSLEGMRAVFDRGGAWAIVCTRGLPFSIPEVIVFLAGLSRMPLRTFVAALAVGSIPTAFVFAALGAGLSDQPLMALLLSYVLPIVLLPIALFPFRARGG